MVNWNYTRLFSTHFIHVEIYHATALFMTEINLFQPYGETPEMITDSLTHDSHLTSINSGNGSGHSVVTQSSNLTFMTPKQL
jgi:hypothetical protein